MKIAKLQAEVEALKKRRKAEGLPLLTKNPLEPPIPAAVEAAIAQELEETKAKVEVLTEVEFRARSFDWDIVPKLRSYGFPPRYCKELKTWTCAPQKAAFDECIRLFQGVGAIVALIGPRGTGKTTIASQIAIKRAWEDWDMVRNHINGTPLTLRSTPYRKLNDLVSLHKPLYSDYGTIETDRLRESINQLSTWDNLIVIDELHESDDIRVSDRVLTDIIDRRYSNHKDTLLISNQTGPQFKASMSDSILSRLSEHGAIIECKWTSFR